MSRFALAVAIVSLIVGVYPDATSAASLSEVILGIGLNTSVSPWRIVQPTSTVMNVDWPVYVLVIIRDVVNEATATVDRTGPDGKALWTRTIRWRGNFRRGWGSSFIPLAGTPNEERVGQWKIVVRVDGGAPSEVVLNVTQAERAVMETLSAEAQKNPNSFTANYRLGAAASLFGTDDLAVTHLKKAAEIARTSVYPHMALGRHYFKRGMKQQALDEFSFAKGLLMGVEERGLAGWLQQVIEEYMKQL